MNTNNPLLPNTNFSIPDTKIWYVTTGNTKGGKFYQKLSSAKGATSTHRPYYPIALIEYDLEKGTKKVLMDFVPPDNCESCGGTFKVFFPNNQTGITHRNLDPLSKTVFEAKVICNECYRRNKEMLASRRQPFPKPTKNSAHHHVTYTLNWNTP